MVRRCGGGGTSRTTVVQRDGWVRAAQRPTHACEARVRKGPRGGHRRRRAAKLARPASPRGAPAVLAWSGGADSQTFQCYKNFKLEWDLSWLAVLRAVAWNLDGGHGG